MKIVEPQVIVEECRDGEEILKSLEKAARTCYKTEDKIGYGSAERLIKGTIMKLGHLSVLEHEKVTFRLITSRDVTHQLVRHRIAS